MNGGRRGAAVTACLRCRVVNAGLYGKHGATPLLALRAGCCPPERGVGRLNV